MYDFFLYDRSDGTVERVNVTSQGKEGEYKYSKNKPQNYYHSYRTVGISDDGMVVMFESVQSNLAKWDRNEAMDIFVRDRNSKTKGNGGK